MQLRCRSNRMDLVLSGEFYQHKHLLECVTEQWMKQCLDLLEILKSEMLKEMFNIHKTWILYHSHGVKLDWIHSSSMYTIIWMNNTSFSRNGVQIEFWQLEDLSILHPENTFCQWEKVHTMSIQENSHTNWFDSMGHIKLTLSINWWWTWIQDLQEHATVILWCSCKIQSFELIMAGMLIYFTIVQHRNWRLLVSKILIIMERLSVRVANRVSNLISWNNNYHVMIQRPMFRSILCWKIMRLQKNHSSSSELRILGKVQLISLQDT